MEGIIQEYGEDMTRAVMREFRQGHEVDKVLARVRQAKIAAASEHLQRTQMEGLGQLRARIDGTAFLDWHVRTGGQCWRDKGFIREYLRDNPDVRVAPRSGRTRISVPRTIGRKGT